MKLFRRRLANDRFIYDTNIYIEHSISTANCLSTVAPRAASIHRAHTDVDITGPVLYATVDDVGKIGRRPSSSVHVLHRLSSSAHAGSAEPMKDVSFEI